MKPGPNAMNTFNRVPSPEYFDFDPMRFFETPPTQQGIDAVQPLALEAELSGRFINSSFTRKDGIGWLVLPVEEFDALVKDPRSKADRAQSRNLTQLPAAQRQQEDRIATAKRAGAHVLEDGVEGMHSHVLGMNVRIDSLRTLLKRAELPYRAHSRGEDLLQMVISAKRDMNRAIQAAADAHGWSDEDLAQAENALDYLLTGEESHKAKLNYWVDMIRFTGNYTRKRRILFIDKIHQSRDIIDELNPSQDAA